MKSLHAKIRQLERTIGRCIECGGHGRIQLVDLRELWKLDKRPDGYPIAHSEVEAEALPGCPICGAKRRIILADAAPGELGLPYPVRVDALDEAADLAQVEDLQSWHSHST